MLDLLNVRNTQRIQEVEIEKCERLKGSSTTCRMFFSFKGPEEKGVITGIALYSLSVISELHTYTYLFFRINALNFFKRKICENLL